MNRQLVLIAHNLRSSHNVGSLLRTADGLGLERLFLTGYTPYPHKAGDKRLPHLAQKQHRQIHKAALGAEDTQKWQQIDSIGCLLLALKIMDYRIVALEQDADAVTFADIKPPVRVALIVGREVEGIEPVILDMADSILEIPMLGSKESFNVAQAAAMALYHLRFMS